MLKLNITNPICAVDVETTGTNTGTDRIVTMSVIKYFPSIQYPVVSEWLINPEIEIPTEATAIHGITNEMVRGKPTFKDLADELHNCFKGCDMIVYNKGFDPIIIAEEFARVRIEYPTQETKIIDPLKIFFKKEERTLSAALKFYCNKEMEGAHDASNDIRATIEVFNAQLERYTDLTNDIDSISEYCETKGRIDAGGKFAYDSDGDEIFTFGQNKNKKVKDNLGMLDWMLGRDFPSTTKIWCRKFLEKYSRKLPQTEEERNKVKKELNDKYSAKAHSLPDF